MWFFLWKCFSYTMLMKLCICFGICLSSKWFCLRLTFLLSNLGLIIAQQTSIPISCFMVGGWHTLCHPISKMHIVGQGPGETPSALRCLSYLTSNRYKTAGKTSRMALSIPLLIVYVRSFLCPFSYFNKTLLHKISWVIKPGPWSQS